MKTLYRYRSNSGLAFKELLYNELVFSKLEELNDPMDAVMEFWYPACVASWQNLFEQVWEEHKLPPNHNTDKLIDYLGRREWGKDKLLAEITESDFVREIGFSHRELSLIADAIRPWTKPNLYVASFSQDYFHPVMWSHYANSHKGFCLEFTVSNNSIPHSKTDDILPIFKNSYGKIIFNSVDYVKTYERLNGFMANPYLCEKDDNLLFSQCIRKMINKKYEHWAYENESRLTLLESVNITGNTEFFPESRIYRYDILQLRGLIFGMNMNKFDKHRIIRIIEGKRSRLRDLLKLRIGRAILPPIAFYDSYQQSPEYRVKRREFMILDDQNEHRYHENFGDVFNEYLTKKESGIFDVANNSYDPLETISNTIIL